MKAFMDKDFLLETDTAKKLYHDYAENTPILDYHCHINPQEIAQDRLVKEKSVAELQKNQARSEEKLRALEKEVKSIRETIEQTEKLVCMKILTDLQQFLTIDMPNAWTANYDQYDGKFGIWSRWPCR